MAQELNSYTIRGTNKVVKVGDCVLMRSEGNPTLHVARLERIHADVRNFIKVLVRWYYWPEATGGRQSFHGAKELMLSDEYDVQSALTIEGKCIVHSFKEYTKLENVGPLDYYCRLEYITATRAFVPDRIAVYCYCENPINPDKFMVKCMMCKERFHPGCLGITIEQAKELQYFACSNCAGN